MQAQSGSPSTRFGAGVLYGTGVGKAGFHFSSERFLITGLSIVPSYTRFAVGRGGRMSQLDFNLRYYLTDYKNEWYVMGGMVRQWAAGDASPTGFNTDFSGFNLGGGVIMHFSDNWGVNFSAAFSNPMEQELVFIAGLVFTLW